MHVLPAVFLSPCHCSPKKNACLRQHGKARFVPSSAAHATKVERRAWGNVGPAEQGGANDGVCAMQSPAKYREYAEQCERIARSVPEEHRKVLLEIAKAWRGCAEEAELMQRKGRGPVDRMGSA